MNHHYFLIIVFYFLFNYSLIETHQIQKSICVENNFQIISVNYLKVCYFNDLENRSILVWFTIGKSLNDTFNDFRFVLRSHQPHKQLQTNNIIEILTNFTSLIDTNNSVRLFNFDSGEYEVCIELRLDSPKLIYQPRDGCILILFGKTTFESFTNNSSGLFIALASSIVLFLFLGLIVQWAKAKRERDRDNQPMRKQTLSSSILSALTLKQQQRQRDRIIGNFIHRYIDEPRTSRLRQWARTLAFRHRISTDENECERSTNIRGWSRLFSPSKSQIQITSHKNLPTISSNTGTLSDKDRQSNSSRNVTFHLEEEEEEEEETV